MRETYYALTMAFILAFLSFSIPCAAFEVRPSGTLQVFTQWSTGSTLGFESPYSEQEVNNNFRGAQYFQLQFDVNPDDAVSATGLFEVDTYWGVDDGDEYGYGEFTGGQIGSQGVNVQTSQLFVHVQPEDSEFRGRAGLISVHMPNQIGGSIILDDTVAAIALAYKFTDVFSGSIVWGRPYDRPNETVSNRTMDIYSLAVKCAAGSQISTPYVLYSNFGKNVSGDPLGSAWIDGSNIGIWNGFSDFSGDPWAFWTGFSGKYHLPCDFVFKSDLMWGTLYGGNDPASREGAVLLGELDWRFRHYTLGILGWWGSGDNANSYENGAGRMPFVSNQWGLTDFGYYRTAITTESTLILQDATGRWTLGLLVDDLSLINFFTSSIKLLYMRGTNSPSIVKNNRFSTELLQGGYRNNWGTYLTTKDWLIELDTESTLKLDERLNLIIRLGYIHIEVDPEVWGTSDTRDAYRAIFLLDYEF
ncbi:outer membrane homotrimeric porin [Halodesulfovibrio spirochaetisodalis]|uniref:Alginate export domain-containing protein n=1 Tax=Halodesulfovibrio spirochaetisodalis TaxID=1560234 RepID=A0A1B7XEL6_9BACT|nr:outer membrane homotrimeric porin [Halodesulfovibrio spirochaetisodalis]OBQ52624.1 hypothetical protein SP90_06490 [Halodesulfovibrio spirochaetisodalis]